VATGFDHKSEFIKGLPEFEKDRGENNVFVHAIDHKEEYIETTIMDGTTPMETCSATHPSSPTRVKDAISTLYIMSTS